VLQFTDVGSDAAQTAPLLRTCRAGGASSDGRSATEPPAWAPSPQRATPYPAGVCRGERFFRQVRQRLGRLRSVDV
jgi:hypothetical protein